MRVGVLFIGTQRVFLRLDNFDVPRCALVILLQICRSMLLMCVQKWQQESSVKLVVIKGAGGKAFCCGGDVRGNGYIPQLRAFSHAYVLIPIVVK